jgi:azurin
VTREGLAACLAIALFSPPPADAQSPAAQDPAPPRILLDQPLRAVEYQLDRLSNDELVRVERNDGDARFRPVYFALLTRPGLARSVRDEALTALVKLDRTDRTAVLLQALAGVAAGDDQTARALLGLLLEQPSGALQSARQAFLNALDGPQPFVLQGAYAGLMLADANVSAAWQAAHTRNGHLVALLRSVRSLPSGKAGDGLRAQLSKSIRTLTNDTQDASVRAEALGALGWTVRDSATFDLLAREVQQGSDPAAKQAAIRSLGLIPEASWSQPGVEPLARAIVALVAAIPPDRRTEPSSVEAIQVAERLSLALPGEPGRAVRRDLRALGVQVVRIEAIREQMLFNVRWFVVEAGTHVQIVLSNPDAMPHNLVVGMPGSLETVGAAASEMPLPTDPAAKPFVPATPLVLAATRLLQEGETSEVGFVAPATAGEYVYACTFPGHWLRMYGVMLVVDSLDAWEAKPATPTDPLTGKPFETRQNN